MKVFVNTMNKINNSWTLVTTIDAYMRVIKTCAVKLNAKLIKSLPVKRKYYIC